MVQLKLVLLKTLEPITQLSVLPLSTSVEVIEIFPVASKYLVMFLTTTIGLVTSSTVTLIAAVTSAVQTPALTVLLYQTLAGKEAGE